MKLGLVGPIPPPSGGMAMQTQQLARLLKEEGIEVELLATNAAYRPRWVERLRGLRAICRLLPFIWSTWRLAGRVDVIHLMANSGWSWQLFAAPVIWLAGLRGTPVIVNYRGGDAASYMARSASRVLPSLRRVAAVVVPSGFLQEVFANYGVDCVIVPNVVDVQRFTARPAQSIEGPLNLFVARNLESIYGLDIAIRALALIADEVDELSLTIAGSGPLLSELQSLAESLGVAAQVQFVGRLNPEEMAAAYATSDIMLNPARVDNMPNSILEALACSVAVVSSDVGGVPFMVEHEKTALLVAVDDAQAMANAVLRLYKDQALYWRMREAGLQLVQNYTWPVVRPQWLSLYQGHLESGT
ncbi:glycosyltransferase family 4 protein [Sediminihaliea albiluteola]|uniref:glycosyltransferase family 4 protein n=1 Tax=Sediminihaliea albiluteola TaxID=2758564 RepID=UPI001C70C826|nr:glycosyltransferase family 4 protein [Sediminihaliea albiluteola]